jgi:hypothetical protein
MDTIEQLVRSFARRTTQNGAVVITTNGHPALVQAFTDLGWSDPYPDPLLLPKPEPVVTRGFTKATIESPERAVMDKPKGRHGG